MTWYADLSPYEYSAGSVPAGTEALNIGWLEAPHEFPHGTVPPEFVEALGTLCRDDRREVMRGWQNCTFEPGRDPFDPPPSIQVGDRTVQLGNGEVRVTTPDGRWLIAPTLVHHYVTAHSYRPPEEFIEAVTARRAAPADA